MPTLLKIFPDPKDLLALLPEELAGVLIEIIPDVSQQSGFVIGGFLEQVSHPHQGHYQYAERNQIELALAEAIAWLQSAGIIIRNPGQPVDWYLLTRRGKTLKTRTDLEAFCKGRVLPVDLLQPQLANKVYHLFVRGDHDTAVFQAFKEVEVAVRKAGTYDNDLVGRPLMSKAFHPETGPLRDQTVIFAERECEMFLFVGAIGHAKNPVSHRDVGLAREDAARLIVFASHLLAIVEQRSNR